MRYFRKDHVRYVQLGILFLFPQYHSGHHRYHSVFPEQEDRTGKSIIFSILGLIAIFYGSDLAVDNCSIIAKNIGISEKLITMVILVIGTSTPELILAITSAKKKEFDIMLGNIIGTNIFNLGFVLGLPIAIFGGVSSVDFGLIDIVLMVLSGTIIYVFAKDDKLITKKEGLIMLAVFIEYYIYVIITGI